MYSYDRRGSTGKQAAISDGPVGRVLNEVWNKMHDVEYKLEHTLKDYDDVAHFADGPAHKDATEMIKKIQAAHKELEHLTMHTFNDLLEAESKFVAKFKDPSDYADKMRKQVFPR